MIRLAHREEILRPEASIRHQITSYPEEISGLQSGGAEPQTLGSGALGIDHS